MEEKREGLECQSFRNVNQSSTNIKKDKHDQRKLAQGKELYLF
jgi:hypothetical protein